MRLEEEKDTALTNVTEELKSDVGDLKSLLTDSHNRTDKRLNTEIGALSDDLISLTSRNLKAKDYLSQIQDSLVGQTETFSKLKRAQYSILTRWKDLPPCMHKQKHV